MVSIEFQIPSVRVNESDGSVIVDLVRTGNHSNNFTVCINVTMIVDPAIAQRMCIMCTTTYVNLNLSSISERNACPFFIQLLVELSYMQ